MNIRDFEILVQQVKESPRFELVKLNVHDAVSLLEEIKKLERSSNQNPSAALLNKGE